MEIVICVGSSCHMKGSYRVVETFKNMIKEHSLENTLTLKASFCMKNCTKGISVSIDGQLIDNVNISNAADRFLEVILPKAVNL